MCVVFRIQLTVMFADGVTRLEKMKKTDNLRVGYGPGKKHPVITLPVIRHVYK